MEVPYRRWRGLDECDRLQFVAMDQFRVDYRGNQYVIVAPPELAREDEDDVVGDDVSCRGRLRRGSE